MYEFSFDKVQKRMSISFLVPMNLDVKMKALLLAGVFVIVRIELDDSVRINHFHSCVFNRILIASPRFHIIATTTVK